MTLEELYKAVDSVEFTEEDKARITERFKVLEEEFAVRSESMRPTAEMLNRLYTL